MRDVTEKMNAVVRHTETDDITQTNKLTMAAAPLGCERSWSEEKQKRKEK